MDALKQALLKRSKRLKVVLIIFAGATALSLVVSIAVGLYKTKKMHNFRCENINLSFSSDYSEVIVNQNVVSKCETPIEKVHKCHIATDLEEQTQSYLILDEKENKLYFAVTISKERLGNLELKKACFLADLLYTEELNLCVDKRIKTCSKLN